MIDKIVSHYRILERIGEGCCARVPAAYSLT